MSNSREMKRSGRMLSYLMPRQSLQDLSRELSRERRNKWSSHQNKKSGASNQRWVLNSAAIKLTPSIRNSWIRWQSLLKTRRLQSKSRNSISLTEARVLWTHHSLMKGQDQLPLTLQQLDTKSLPNKL